MAKRLLRTAVGFGALVAPATALGSAPAGRGSEDPSEVQSAALGQSRADPVFVSGPSPTAAAHSPVAPTILYVNFDGAELEAGSDDARIDRTTIGVLEGSFEEYGGGAKQEAVLQSVKEDWAAYNVVVTDRRPESGDYVMNLVGPTEEYPSDILGIAPLDCGNRSTPNNITFAFHSTDDGHSATTTATTISQEVAHSFGLEHVDEPSDIMNPVNAGGDPSFTDGCLPLVDDIKCPEQHEAECDEPFLQNAHQELYTLLGPAGPGGPGPDLLLLEPDDGDHFELGEPLLIEVGAEEGLVIRQAALFVNGVLTDTDEAPPFGWTTDQVDEGEYEIYVEALDDNGLLHASAISTITVSGDTSPHTDAGPLPGTYGREGGTPQQSCSVTADPAGGTTLLALPFVLLLAAGRRRDDSTMTRARRRHAER